MSRSAAPHRRVSASRRQRGLAAVEFVVTAPFVLLLLLACAEVGRAFVHYATLTYSVRDAVRFVSTNALNGTTGVVELSGTAISQAKNLAVYGSIDGTGVAKLPLYQIGHVDIVDAGDSNIRCRASAMAPGRSISTCRSP
jgi:Flp pilus assembly protein TadG